jgi:hypothetical protein
MISLRINKIDKSFDIVALRFPFVMGDLRSDSKIQIENECLLKGKKGMLPFKG